MQAIRIMAIFVIVAGILSAPFLYAAADVANPAAAPEGQDAAVLYRQADQAIKVDSPSATSLGEDPPPYTKAWRDMAAAAFKSDVQTRQLVLEAGKLNHANWSDRNDDLAVMRELAWNLGDAALYVNLIRNDAQAGELISDGMRLADPLDGKPIRNVQRILVDGSIGAIMSSRLQLIASNVILTNDPANTRDLQVKTAKELIEKLLQYRDAKEQLADAVGPVDSQAWKDYAGIERVVQNLNIDNAERACAAISLACHLFRFDNGRWPNSLAELTPKYLPEIPIDPFGQGKPIGYVLLEHGLPDGGQRPLVYFRYQSQDGLAYRVDQPFYQWTEVRIPGPNGDTFKYCGQFRDIASWLPKPGKIESTTRPLAQP